MLKRICYKDLIDKLVIKPRNKQHKLAYADAYIWIAFKSNEKNDKEIIWKYIGFKYIINNMWIFS